MTQNFVHPNSLQTLEPNETQSCRRLSMRSRLLSRVFERYCLHVKRGPHLRLLQHRQASGLRGERAALPAHRGLKPAYRPRLTQPATMTTTTAASSHPPPPPQPQSFPNCYSDYNPVDFYRAYISNELSKISGVDANIIYPALSWTAKLEKGDLSLAIPALRLKGQKPAELGEKWANEVGGQHPAPTICSR